MEETQQLEAAAVWVPVDRLKPWARNPRKNDAAVDRVVESIRRFGFGAPLLARAADGEIIAGHTRLRAALKLGLRQVPVRYLELDPADAHLLALADNKLGELSEWDDSALGKLLAELRAEDVNLTDGIGFSDEEIRRLIASPATAEEGAGSSAGQEEPPLPDPTDALLQKWGVEPGQLWAIRGKRGTMHHLLCGDCRRPEDVARVLDGRKINSLSRVRPTQPSGNMTRPLASSPSLPMPTWTGLMRCRRTSVPTSRPTARGS